MTSPILSIIVPVYKSEKYLDACVQSIINQTFRDWELILVDDGSPDKSGALCDAFAELFSVVPAKLPPCRFPSSGGFCDFFHEILIFPLVIPLGQVV